MVYSAYLGGECPIDVHFLLGWVGYIKTDFTYEDGPCDRQTEYGSPEILSRIFKRADMIYPKTYNHVETDSQGA